MHTNMFVFLKMFSMFVRCLEMCVFVFENGKDICLKIDQVTRSNLPTEMSFLCIFSPLTLLIYH